MQKLDQRRSNGMTRDDFWAFVRDLAVYFGLEKLAKPTQAGKEQLKVWFEQLEGMPAEPLQWIGDRIKITYDEMPRNLPKVMWALWYQWSAEHPERQAENTYSGNCDCHGGAIIVKKDGEWVAVRCLNCMPPLKDEFERADLGGKRKRGVWQSTVNDLKRKGWTIYRGSKLQQREKSVQEVVQKASDQKRTKVAF
jgi:hypothetical protein